MHRILSLAAEIWVSAIRVYILLLLLLLLYLPVRTYIIYIIFRLARRFL